MNTPFKVLTASLLAGTMFTSSLTPAFAEWNPDNPIEVGEGEAAITEVSDTDVQDPAVTPVPTDNDTIEGSPPPLDTGRGVTRFKDVPVRTELAYAVQFLDENGIAKGLSEEIFGVNDPIKRVDFAMILGTYMPLDTNVPNAGFRDLPARATKIVSALKYNGVTSGKSATLFGAGDNITRGEAVVMQYNAYKDYFDSSETIKNPFTDATGRYAEPVRVLSGSGIIKGKGGAGKFSTNGSITRGEFALLVYRINQHEQKMRAEAKSGFVAFGDSNTSGSYFGEQYKPFLDKQWTDQVAAVYGVGLEEVVYNVSPQSNNA